jgi:hypothetical protein
MSDMAPGWMVAEVAEGIQRLLVLRLEGCPPADAVEAVALAWVDALLARYARWDEALDAPRIRQGFRILSAQSKRWPAPAFLLEAMPPRPEPKQLPPPALSAEDRARFSAMLRDLKERFAS